MSQKCDRNCSSCASNCSERTAEQTDFRAKMNQFSDIKRVIAVVSGKGGVGKSLVTSLLAVHMSRQGYKTAILDADITGPSIPQAFGLHKTAHSDERGIMPVRSKSGLPIISLNLLVKDETDPVVWRGPLLGGVVKQFWSDVVWGDIDYMFVDMPPGTGDVPLTVYQSLPIAGIIVVTSPQQLVGMIVEKAVKMAAMLNIPVLGLVENMSYYHCPDCGHEHHIFGESHVEDIAAKLGVGAVSRLPIRPELAAAVDAGQIERIEEPALDPIIEELLK